MKPKSARGGHIRFAAAALFLWLAACSTPKPGSTEWIDLVGAGLAVKVDGSGVQNLSDVSDIRISAQRKLGPLHFYNMVSLIDLTSPPAETPDFQAVSSFHGHGIDMTVWRDKNLPVPDLDEQAFQTSLKEIENVLKPREPLQINVRVIPDDRSYVASKWKLFLDDLSLDIAFRAADFDTGGAAALQTIAHETMHQISSLEGRKYAPGAHGLEARFYEEQYAAIINWCMALKLTGEVKDLGDETFTMERDGKSYIAPFDKPVVRSMLADLHQVEDSKLALFIVMSMRKTLWIRFFGDLKTVPASHENVGNLQRACRYFGRHPASFSDYYKGLFAAEP